MQEMSWPTSGPPAEGPKTRANPREIFLTRNRTPLLLSQYWTRPCDEEELVPYLTVGASFVQFVLRTHGPSGLAQLLSSLPPSSADSGWSHGTGEDFIFKGSDLFSLELKWKRFLDREVSSPFSLGHFGLVFDLCKKYYKTCSAKVAAIVLIILINVSLQLGLAIMFSSLLGFGFNVNGSDLKTVFMSSSLVLLLIFARFLFANGAALLVTKVTVCVGVDLRRRIACRIHCVSYGFFADHTPGSILSTFSKDVSSVESFVSVSMTTLLWACLMLCACIGYAISVAWPLGLGLAVAYIIMHLLAAWLSTFLGHYNLKKSGALDACSDLFKETLDGYKENRIYRCASHWLSKIEAVLVEEYSRQAFKSNLLVQFVMSIQSFVPHALGVLLVVGIFVLSAHEWVSFERGLSVYIMYQLTLMAVSSASGHYSTLESARIGMTRINSLLYNKSHDMNELGQVPEDSLGSLLLRSRLSCRGRRGVPLSFEGVSFCYSSLASHWTLYDVSFNMSPGERVAIVGESGSGKSTILNLILQVLLPTEGSVFIAGRETTGRPDGSAVAIFQSNHVFATSLRENVRIGRLDADEEEIEEACHLAGLAEWAEGLPHRYDTLLCSAGGRGGAISSSSLSGGQVQRIGLARVLLSNAPILLLDEMTSALDRLTEAKVFSTVMDVTRGRTLLSVTHNIEQAKFYDRIMVVSHGRIKEIGTHSELMSAEGHYYQLVQRQGGVVSPSRPTPIRQRHSLLHVMGPETPCHRVGVSHSRIETPVIVEPTPLLSKATPLQTVDEEPSHLGTTVLFPNEGAELEPKSLSHDDRNISIENPFPQMLSLPSSTPNKQ